MLPWKLRKRQFLPVNQNLSSVHFSLAKFQLVSSNLFLPMIWQMTPNHKLPKLCSATLNNWKSLNWNKSSKWLSSLRLRLTLPVFKMSMWLFYLEHVKRSGEVLKKLFTSTIKKKGRSQYEKQCRWLENWTKNAVAGTNQTAPYATIKVSRFSFPLFIVLSK